MPRPFGPGPHEAAQTSILAQLHDELEATVIEAYGWNTDPISLSPSSPPSLLKNKKPMNRDKGDEGDEGDEKQKKNAFVNPGPLSEAETDLQPISPQPAKNLEMTIVSFITVYLRVSPVVFSPCHVFKKTVLPVMNGDGPQLLRSLNQGLKSNPSASRQAGKRSR